MKIQLTFTQFVIALLLAASTFAGAQLLTKRDVYLDVVAKSPAGWSRAAAVKEAPNTVIYLESIICERVVSSIY